MSLITSIQEKIDTKLEGIAWLGDRIVLVDSEKTKWDDAIVRVDAYTSEQIEEVNTTILDVGAAYKARIEVGCRTDLFWRVVGYTTATGSGPTSTPKQWRLKCTKMNVVGYSGTGTLGPGTIFTLYNGIGTAGMTTSSLTSKYGFTTDFYHGIKQFNEPWTEDIGDTLVGSFIGTVSTGSSILTIMQPEEEGIGEDLKAGQLITCERVGILPSTYTKIYGIGTATADLSGITTVGYGVTDVVTVILDTAAVGFASVPPYGEYVDFTVSDDPVSISTYSDYGVPWGKNPMSPQTIGIMGSGPLGVGTFVVYDNSGISSNTQSWKPETRTDTVPEKAQNTIRKYGTEVLPPSVGAGRSHYWVGFSSTPVLLGGVIAVEGDSRIIQSTFLSSTLFEDLSTCSTEEADLAAKIVTRDDLESEFVSGIGTFVNIVSASSALRWERQDFNKEIWGIRTMIGKMNDEINEYKELQNYINTYPELIEPSDGT